MTGLLSGSQYSLGVLAEVLLNLEHKETENGAVKRVKLSSLHTAIDRIYDYLEKTAENDRVDSITLTSEGQEFTLEAFSFKGDEISSKTVDRVIPEGCPCQVISIEQLYRDL